MPPYPKRTRAEAEAEAEASIQSAQVATSNRTLHAFIGGHRPAWLTNGDQPHQLSRPAARPRKVISHAVKRRSLPENSGKPTSSSMTPVPVASQPDLNMSDVPRQSLPSLSIVGQPGDLAPSNAVLPSPALTNNSSPVLPERGNDSPIKSKISGASLTEVPTACNPAETPAEHATVDNSEAVSSGQGEEGDGSDPLATGHQLPSQPSTALTPGNQSQVNAPGNELHPSGMHLAPNNLHGQPVLHVETATSGNNPRLAHHAGSVGHNIKDSPSPLTPTPSAVQVGLIMSHWLREVDTRLGQFNRPDSLHHAVEAPRYRILRDACAQSDYFYIIFHRHFCLWSRDRATLYAEYHGLVAPQTIDDAFNELLQVLRPNYEIASHHLQWFSEFPSSLNRDAAPVVQYWKSQIAEFLIKYSRDWPLASVKIASRGVPITAGELKDVLNCRSRVLQLVIFTMSRRSLGILDGPRASQLNALFNHDQNVEQWLSEGRRMPNQVADARREIWLQYTSLMTQNSLANPRTGPSHYASHQAYQSPRAVEPGTVGMSSAVPQNPPASQIQPPRTVTSGWPLGSSMSNSAQTATTGGRGIAPPIGTSSLGFVGLSGDSQPTTSSMPIVPTAQTPMARTSYPADPRQAQSRSQQPIGIPSHMVLSSSQNPNPQHTTNARDTLAIGHGSGPGGVPTTQQTRNSGVDNALFSDSNVQGLPQQPGRPPVITQTGALIATRTAVPSSTPTPRSVNLPPVDEYGWTSVRPSLHLLHLRSPKRTSVSLATSPHYQFITRLAVGPTHIVPQNRLWKLKFWLTEEQLSKVNPSVEPAPDDPPASRYYNGSYRYRLRLCALPDDRTPDEEDWVVLAAHWPEHIFITFNGEPQFTLRKQHSHHDRPIELTRSLVQGENLVEVSIPVSKLRQAGNRNYFMAVEVVQTLSHESVKALVDGAKHVGAGDIMQELGRRLGSSGSDDDIMVINDTLTVSVADPFSGSLYKVPVRGNKCRHLECFDLETWLQTRPRKPIGEPCEPCMTDVWKCPICDSDCRPSSLRIDDFFAQIAQKLASNSDTHVKHVTLRKDGRWEAVKVDDDPNHDSDESPGPRHSERAAPEVIEID
ncbi:hypothetical protein B0I35DRAFT_132410 [Stachybotrys elegans]|uniref:SP-RING-type domain-containing protein n=1 Tax=Stachybotrys elegans TaxID=80388 RepID=A0A8K0SZK9_9HYPO|nr:hypothetical protein B0I35DRAFT_132410 [Stachybotrys elegans]